MTWWRGKALLAVVAVLLCVLVLLIWVDHALAQGEVTAAEITALELVRYLTWPGAVAVVALSPLGRGMGEWFRQRATVGSQAPLPAVVAEALREVAGTLREVSTTQNQIQQAIAILLDRTARDRGD